MMWNLGLYVPLGLGSQVNPNYIQKRIFTWQEEERKRYKFLGAAQFYYEDFNSSLVMLRGKGYSVALKLQDSLTRLGARAQKPQITASHVHQHPSSQTIFIACFEGNQHNCFSRSEILKVFGVMNHFEHLPKTIDSNSRQKCYKLVRTLFFQLM